MRGRQLVAGNLKRFRAQLDMSQEELAHQAGIDRTYVSSLELCKYSASVDVLERLADALSVDIEELFRSVK